MNEKSTCGLACETGICLETPGFFPNGDEKEDSEVWDVCAAEPGGERGGEKYGIGERNHRRFGGIKQGYDCHHCQDHQQGFQQYPQEIDQHVDGQEGFERRNRRQDVLLPACQRLREVLTNKTNDQ